MVLEFWRKWDFWKIEKLVVVEEGKRKRKKKRNYNEKIFLFDLKDENIEKADSRV